MNPESIIDYGRFSERLLATSDRWALLHELLREWHQEGPHALRVWDEGELAAAASELGVPIPAALRTWYELGARPLLSCPNPETLPLRPEREETGQYITFAMNIMCCRWGFRVRDAALPDPPIYAGLEFEGEKTQWFFQSPTLSEWALQRIIGDLVISGSPSATLRHVPG